MAFPRSLSTKEMTEYVIRHFAWDQRGLLFPPSPLPKDFQALCPSYELAMAEEVEFISPSGESEGVGDEVTNPLDVETGASKEEGRDDSGEPDV